MSQSATTHRRHRLAFLLVLAAFFFLCPARTAALPIAGYQQNLQRAITALDTLAQVDEDESETEFEKRLAGTIAGVRAVLPAHQTIEADGESCTVDNSWLHKTFDELEELAADEQLQRIKQVVESLRALEAGVAERQNPGSLVQSKEQAKSKLESILARPEYVTGARGSSALVRLLQDFARWLQKFFPKRRSVDPGRVDLISLIAQILVIGAALLLLAYVVKILAARFGRSGKIKTPKKRELRIVLGERLEPDATATDLLSEAEALARQGDLRAAIRKAYIALLVELGDRKLISLAHHKTNRDYLNSVSTIPRLHFQMKGLTNSFERHWYGYDTATPNDWQDFRAAYLAALQGGN